MEDRDEHEKSEPHFGCDSCHVKFSNFTDFQKHRKDPNCKALICPICKRNFQDPKESKSWSKNIIFKFT